MFTPIESDFILVLIQDYIAQQDAKYNFPTGDPERYLPAFELKQRLICQSAIAKILGREVPPSWNLEEFIAILRTQLS